MLAQIEALLTKKIEVIKVSKTDYAMIASQPSEELSFAEMIELEEKMIKEAKRKKKK
ncbi:hypothetical protein D3C87_2155440 [compost metagenome]